MLRSPVEELLNSITHGFGLMLSLVGAVALASYFRQLEDAWRILGCSIYASALIAVYAASTLSHVTTSPRARRLFRNLDQAFIYLLIVATYTPFGLTFLRTGWWLVFLGVMWAAALAGFFSKILFSHQVDSVSIRNYVLLGWMPIVAAIPLIQLVSVDALLLMLIGGLCYTIGTAFLVCDHRAVYFHAIWHLFVIAGSTCHFVAILMAVAQGEGSA